MAKTTGWVAVALMTGSLLYPWRAGAQESRAAVAPWTGSMGITETVRDIMAREAVSRQRAVRVEKPLLRANRAWLPQNALAPDLSRWPISRGTNSSERGPISRPAPQTAGLSFDGATVSDTPPYYPPDAMGAAGPTQFLVAINGRFRTFNKATGIKDGALDVSPDTMFSSVITPASLSDGITDPRCRFDRLTNRWYIICIDLAPTNNRVLLAVSSGPTITAQSSFTFFYFQHNSVSPAGDTGYFADYPTLGLDANALYIGLNMFTSGNDFRGSSGFVVRKSSIQGAGPIVVKAFRGLCTATNVVFNPGPYTPQGVDNDDPAATEGYFIGVDNANFGLLVVRRVITPGGTPTISANLNIVVPVTAYPPTPGINVLGSTCPLDASDDRLMMAQLKLNPSTGQRTLWTAHTIGVDTSGTGSDIADRAAVRWYEIQNLTTTPALKQSGTLFDSAASSPRNYTFPAIAMSGQGHVALSASTGGKLERLGIALSGRLNGDAAGVLKEVTMTNVATTNYNAQACTTNNTFQRWGDYAYTCVDPSDDMTMWTVQEYCNGTNSWAVRVIRLLAPLPATPVSCLPASLAPGAAGVNVVLTGASAAGSGFFDPGAGFTGRIAASVSGTGVTVNSVTYNNPTQLTLNITVAADAPGGPRSITVTNPDGQAVTSVAGILSIAGTMFTTEDAINALKIAGGLSAASSAQAVRYGIVNGAPVDAADAAQILRKVMGLGTNP